MSIKTKIRSKMMEVFFHLKERTYKSRVKYIYENNRSDKLAIVFPAFPSGDKPMYNYYRTLNDVNMDKLFLLDNFGYKGSYLLFENGGGCPRTQFEKNSSSKMAGKTINSENNHVDVMNKDAEICLNSDTLLPGNSVGGVFGRPGGGRFFVD